MIHVLSTYEERVGEGGKRRERCQTDRKRDRQADRDRDGETELERQTERQTDRQAVRQTDRQRDTHRENEKGRDVAHLKRKLFTLFGKCTCTSLSLLKGVFFFFIWTESASRLPSPAASRRVDKHWMLARAGRRGRIGVVGWLFNVPAICECILGTDLLRQVYVLPHWDRSCRSNFPSHPVTVCWHRADQSQRWPYNARRLAG